MVKKANCGVVGVTGLKHNLVLKAEKITTYLRGFCLASVTSCGSDGGGVVASLNVAKADLRNCYSSSVIRGGGGGGVDVRKVVCKG